MKKCTVAMEKLRTYKTFDHRNTGGTNLRAFYYSFRRKLSNREQDPANEIVFRRMNCRNKSQDTISILSACRLKSWHNYSSLIRQSPLYEELNKGDTEFETYLDKFFVYEV